MPKSVLVWVYTWSSAWSVVGLGGLALALLVAAMGFRRRIAEVQILGAFLFAVAGLLTSHAVAGAEGRISESASWPLLLALPLGLVATLPLLASKVGVFRRLAQAAGVWSAAASVAVALLSLALARSDSEPSQSVVAAAIGFGLLGTALLAARQLVLFNYSLKVHSLAVGTGIAVVGGSWSLALGAAPESTVGWSALVGLAVGLAATVGGVLGGYRYDPQVGLLLRPLTDYQPLSALEAGLSPEVEAFSEVLAGHDRTVRDHAVRTSAVVCHAAAQSGLSMPEVRALALGGLLHDIGNQVVPSQIARRFRQQTDEELEALDPSIRGQRLLEAAPSLRAAAPYVRGHREQPDGNGHPDGLKGDELSFGLGLVAAADAWDTLTNDPGYRSSLTATEAERLLHDGAGVRWRHDAVEAILAAAPAAAQVDLGDVPVLNALLPSRVSWVEADEAEPDPGDEVGALSDSEAPPTAELNSGTPTAQQTQPDPPAEASQHEGVAALDQVKGPEDFLVRARHEIARHADRPGEAQLVYVRIESTPVDEDVRRGVEAVVRSVIRADDLVGRLRPDTFAVLLPSAPAGISEKLAERIRRAADVLLLELSVGAATNNDLGSLGEGLGSSSETEAASPHDPQH